MDKLRLRLALIAALPEPIILDRLRRLAPADLAAFRKRYGIQECRSKGQCAIRSTFHATKAQHRELRNCHLLTSMYQTRCKCEASQQHIPPIPFTAHQVLAQRLVPEGEKRPHR